MKRDSFFLNLIRILISLAILGLLIMVYWSSALLEEDMKQLQNGLAQVNNELKSIRSIKVQHNITNSQIDKLDKPEMLNKIVSLNDSKYPNLLTQDPFFKTTLPKLLPTDFEARGLRKDATGFKPENLHPFSNWGTVISWIGQCNVSIAQNAFGRYETYVPDFAIRFEERPTSIPGIPEYWIFLRDDVYWQPLKPSYFSEPMELAPHFLQKVKVTAHDIKFYYDAVMNPYVQDMGAVALRPYFADIEEVRVIDDTTLVVRWKGQDVIQADGKVVKRIKFSAKQLTGSLSPLARFVYQYFPNGKKILEDDSDPNTYAKNSLWAQNFAHHWAKNIIVSCGAWVFEGMTDQQISFKRNPDYYEKDAVLVEGLEVQFKDSPESIWNSFKEGKLDTYIIQPTQLNELANFLRSPEYLKQEKIGLGIHRLDYLARTFTFIGWNEAKPYFASPKVRRALTMSIDRKRIIQQNLNGMGIELSCPAFINSPSYDHSIEPWPFDPEQAKRLLEEEGWYDSDGDGVIDKEINGVRVPFRFTMTYYVKSALVRAICEYIASALKEVGIVCNLNGVEITDLSSTFDEKSFDAVIFTWGFGNPPDDHRQLWHSSGAKLKGSSNAIGFSNAEVDKIIDQLTYEDNLEIRQKLYYRFDEIIHHECPYTLLFISKQTLLYRDYVKNVFIPADRQDLIPGADVEQPSSSIFWLNQVREGQD